MADRNRDLVKWTGIVAILTLTSKAFGFLRETALAYQFGATLQADAYIVAITIPGLLFTAIITAIRNTFIPVYGRLRDSDSGDQLFNTSVVGLTAILLPVTILAILFTPVIVRISGGLGLEGQVFNLSVQLTRILLPSVLIMGMVGLAGGYLNAHHRFTIPAIIAIPHDIIIIFSALYLGSIYGIQGLAWGTLAGYVSQLLIQVPAVLKERVNFKAGINWKHPGLREMAYLLPPIIIATAAGELKIVIDRQFASFLSEGIISMLHYGSKVYQLPTGIITVALVTVFYPTFVDLAESGRMRELRQTMSRGAALIIFLLVPVTLGFLALGTPIIRLLFQRGDFGAEATAGTNIALTFYSLGLVFIGIKEVINRVFFSLKDTRTPMIISLITLVMNIIFNFLLMGPLQHGGIALSTSIANAVAALLSLLYLHRKVGRIDGTRLLNSFWKALVSGAVMIIPVYYLYSYWIGIWLPVSFTGQLVQLTAMVAMGAAVYFAVAWILKVEEIDYAIGVGRQFIRRWRR